MIVVTGADGFIGAALMNHLGTEICRGYDGRSEPQPEWFEGASHIVNCAFHPALFSTVYSTAFDLDLRIALMAKAAGAKFVMLSSRRVYAQQAQLGATEDSPRKGIDFYSKNKIVIEDNLQSLLSADDLLILRACNVIGFEYRRKRPSFMSFILDQLAKYGRVEFNCDPSLVRDFVPVEHFAETIAMLLKEGSTGILNVGSGTRTPIGAIPPWVIDGLGAGVFDVTERKACEEFSLDISRLSRIADRAYPIDRLEKYCRTLGAKLSQEVLAS